jgi:hypothetical protein
MLAYTTQYNWHTSCTARDIYSKESCNIPDQGDGKLSIMVTKPDLISGFYPGQLVFKEDLEHAVFSEVILEKTHADKELQILIDKFVEEAECRLDDINDDPIEEISALYGLFRVQATILIKTNNKIEGQKTVHEETLKFYSTPTAWENLFWIVDFKMNEAQQQQQTTSDR